MSDHQIEKLIELAAKSPKPIARVVRLDSDMATELLERAATNRDIRRSRVARYRADMEGGQESVGHLRGLERLSPRAVPKVDQGVHAATAIGRGDLAVAHQVFVRFLGRDWIIRHGDGDGRGFLFDLDLFAVFVRVPFGEQLHVHFGDQLVALHVARGLPFDATGYAPDVRRNLFVARETGLFHHFAEPLALSDPLEHHPVVGAVGPTGVDQGFAAAHIVSEQIGFHGIGIVVRFGLVDHGAQYATGLSVGQLVVGSRAMADRAWVIGVQIARRTNRSFKAPGADDNLPIFRYP